MPHRLVKHCVWGVALLLMCRPASAQIIPDPAHKNRMVYKGETVTVFNRTIAKPCVLVGPGDPEDLFYNSPQQNIELLTSRKATTTYVAAYLSDFGGGKPGAGAAFDSSLIRWDEYITTLENAGITTFFFFLDDGVRLPQDWKVSFEKIVRKLKHHRLLVWSIAEEYAEALSRSQVEEVAAFIRGLDSEHVIGIHQNHETDFNFNTLSSLDMFLMQYNVASDTAIYNGVYTALLNTRGNRILNLSEVANHGQQLRADLRKWNWAAVMAGASVVQVLNMGRASDPKDQNEPEKYRDCRMMTDFLQGIDFNPLLPRQDLKALHTKWLLAKPGCGYLAYADNEKGSIGIRSLPKGKYFTRWLDVATGAVVEDEVNESGTKRASAFVRPKGFGAEVVLYLQKEKSVLPEERYVLPDQPTDARKLPNHPAVVAFNEERNVETGKAVTVLLRMKSNGPGPFEYKVMGGPKNGKVELKDNDLVYTPSKGFTGTDSILYTVTDKTTGIVSNKAKILFEVK